MRPTTIQKCFSIIAECYPGRFTPTTNGEITTAEVWLKMLGDIPEHLGEAAVIQLCSSEVYPPTISQIRETALDLSEGNVSAPSAWEAWERALEGQPGTSTEVRALKAVGGSWGLKHAEHIGVTRSNFVQAYTELMDRERKRRLAIPVVKLLARENKPETVPLEVKIEEASLTPPTPEEVKELLKGLRFYQ